MIKSLRVPRARDVCVTMSYIHTFLIIVSMITFIKNNHRVFYGESEVYVDEVGDQISLLLHHVGALSAAEMCAL